MLSAPPSSTPLTKYLDAAASMTKEVSVENQKNAKEEKFITLIDPVEAQWNNLHAGISFKLKKESVTLPDFGIANALI